MADQDLQEQMGVMAVQQVVTWLVAEFFKTAADPNAKAQEWLIRAEGLSDLMAFPGVHPAQSDHGAQIFRDALVRMLKRAQALATGAPFDPGSYSARQS